MPHVTSSVSLAIAVSLLYPVVSHAQDGPVSGKEVQETWVGKDLTGTTASGAKVLMRLEQDGKALLTAGNTSDSGTWRPSDTGYCTTWKTIRAGQERCFTVTRAAGVFKVANPDGSPSGQFTAIR